MTRFSARRTVTDSSQPYEDFQSSFSIPSFDRGPPLSRGNFPFSFLERAPFPHGYEKNFSPRKFIFEFSLIPP